MAEDQSTAPGWWRSSDGTWNPPVEGQLVHDFDDGFGPVLAHQHENGGGWVANSAVVAETAFVGGSAAVFERASVLDSAVVTDKAWVRGDAQISELAWIAGDAVVEGTSRVFGSAVIEGDVLISGSTTISQSDHLDGHLHVHDGELVEEAEAEGTSEVDAGHCTAGHPLDEGSNFCSLCGAPRFSHEQAPTICGSCRATVKPGAAYCSSCGASISPQPSFPPPPPPSGYAASYPAPPPPVPQIETAPGSPQLYPASPYLARPSRGTNGMAIASMVLGIVWVWWVGSILALIFGYIGLRQIRDRNESGRGMAIAGVVLGWIGVGTLVLFIVLLVVGAFHHSNNYPYQ